MYQSNYNASPTLTLNPFTDSIEAIAVFKANKEFLDSLNKAIVDAGGNPESMAVVRLRCIHNQPYLYYTPNYLFSI